MVSEGIFLVLRDDFSFGTWLRRPGGQGGFRPPPYAPLDPLYPLQTAEGYPRTPLVAQGVLPLFLDRQEPYRARPLFGLGPATNRVPQRPLPLPGI